MVSGSSKLMLCAPGSAYTNSIHYHSHIQLPKVPSRLLFEILNGVEFITLNSSHRGWLVVVVPVCMNTPGGTLL